MPAEFTGLNYSEQFVVCNEFDLAERMLVKRPQEALSSQYLVEKSWEASGWRSIPKYHDAAEQHFRFTKMLRFKELAVSWMPEEWVMSMNSMLIRDPVIMTPAGFISGVLVPAARQGECDEVSEYLEQLGVVKVGEIEFPAKLSGADIIWLNSENVVVGLSEDTNIECVDQLKSIFEKHFKLKSVKIHVTQIRNLESSSTPPRVRLNLTTILAPISPTHLVICSELLLDYGSDFIEKFTILEINYDQWNNFGADIYLANPRLAYFAKIDENQLEVIKPIIEFLKNQGIVVVTPEFSQLSLSKAGPTAFVLPFKRLR